MNPNTKPRRVLRGVCTFCNQPSENPFYCKTCDEPAQYRTVERRPFESPRFTTKPLRRLKGRP